MVRDPGEASDVARATQTNSGKDVQAVKVAVLRDSLWPYFHVARSIPGYRVTSPMVSVPKEIYGKWLKANQLFNEAQKEMRFYYEKNH